MIWNKTIYSIFGYWVESHQHPNTFLKTIVQALKSYVHFLLDVSTVLIIKPTGNNQFLAWGKAYKGETPGLPASKNSAR